MSEHMNEDTWVVTVVVSHNTHNHRIDNSYAEVRKIYWCTPHARRDPYIEYVTYSLEAIREAISSFLRRNNSDYMECPVVISYGDEEDLPRRR